jgi:hypothetical protein
LPLVFLGLLPLLFLRNGLRPIGDPDTFWHIKAGGYLWETGNFSGDDPWSAHSTHPWVLHEWLPELAMAGAAKVAGLPGVAWLNCLAIAALFTTVYLICRSRATIMPAVIAAAVAVFGASASLTPRPQLVSFILLAVVTGAWLKTAVDGRPRWWLIPLQWVWACSHGMWFAGVLVGLVVVSGLLLDSRVTPREAARLLAVPLLGAAVAALTPAGPGVLIAPLKVSGMTAYVSEWNPPSLLSPNVAVTMCAAAAVAVLWLRRGQRTPWSHVAVLAMAVGWTLLYARTVALGAVMLAPLLAMALQSLHPDEDEPSTASERATLGASVAASLLVALVALPHLAAKPAEVPNGLDAQLRALPQGTVIFDEYSLGGWLLWRHPQLVPVIDPRTEIYDPAYVRAHVLALGAMPGWEDTVTKSAAAYALLPEQSPLAYALERGPDWAALARDSGFVLLMHKT